MINDFVINSRSDRKGSGGVSNYDGSVSIISTVLKPNNHFYNNYTNYLLTNKNFQEEFYRYGKGIVDDMWSTKYRDMKNIRIPVPPINEQKEISDFIRIKSEKINNFVKKKQRFIELLKEQRQSIINHAVTKGINPNVKKKDSGIEWLGEVPEQWEVKRLKNVCDIRFSNVDKHSNDNETQVRLCNYIDVYKNEYIKNDFDFMQATATEEEINKFKVEKDDVIITKDSETADDIASPAMIIEDLENVVCGYHLAQLKPFNKLIRSEYLFRLFQSKKINSHFEVSATGVTRVGLSMDDITSVYLPIPSIEEQEKIIKYIKIETATLQTTISKAEREIELMKEYKEAMIAEAVVGKI